MFGGNAAEMLVDSLGPKGQRPSSCIVDWLAVSDSEAALAASEHERMRQINSKVDSMPMRTTNLPILLFECLLRT